MQCLRTLCYATYSLAKHGLWDDPASAEEGPIYAQFTRVVEPFGFKTKHGATYLAWRFGYLAVCLFFNIIFLGLQLQSDPGKCSMVSMTPFEASKENAPDPDTETFPVRMDWISGFEDVCSIHSWIVFACQILIIALLFASLWLARPSGALNLPPINPALRCRSRSRLFLFLALALMILPHFCLYYVIEYYKLVKWGEMDAHICTVFSTYVFAADEALERGVTGLPQSIKNLNPNLNLNQLNSDLQKTRTNISSRAMHYSLANVKAQAAAQGIQLDDLHAQATLTELQALEESAFWNKTFPLPHQAGPSYHTMLTFLVKNGFVAAENSDLVNGAINKWCTDKSSDWSHAFNYNTRCLWALKEEWVADQKNSVCSGATCINNLQDSVSTNQFLVKFAAANDATVCDSFQNQMHSLPPPLNQMEWSNPTKLQQYQLEFVNYFYFTSLISGTKLAGGMLKGIKLMYRVLLSIDAFIALFPLALGVLNCLPESLLNLKGVFPGSRTPGNILAMISAMVVFIYAVALGIARQVVLGGFTFLVIILLYLVYKAFSVGTGVKISQFGNSPEAREMFYSMNMKLEIGLRNFILVVIVAVFCVAFAIQQEGWMYAILLLIGNYLKAAGGILHALFYFIVSYMASKSIFAICVTDYLCKNHVLDRMWFEHKLDKDQQAYYTDTAEDLYKLLHVRHEADLVEDLRDENGDDIDLPELLLGDDDDGDDSDEDHEDTSV